jgi:hypothetical protein
MEASSWGSGGVESHFRYALYSRELPSLTELFAMAWVPSLRVAVALISPTAITAPY